VAAVAVEILRVKMEDLAAAAVAIMHILQDRDMVFLVQHNKDIRAAQVVQHLHLATVVAAAVQAAQVQVEEV
jgi:hypothetical protein